MNSTTNDLALRLAAAFPMFRPLPGMVDREGWRVWDAGPRDGDKGWWIDVVHTESGQHEYRTDVGPQFVADLDDGATLGAIEHGLLPKLYDDPNVRLCCDKLVVSWWVFAPGTLTSCPAAASKREALVLAVEHAPKR